MIGKSLILMWIIWYVYTYGPPPQIFNFLLRFLYIYQDFFTYFNKLAYLEYWDENVEYNNEIKISETEPPKPQPKYEDKFLNDIRKLNKEWTFTEEEKLEFPQLIQDFLNTSIENRLNTINELNDTIKSLNEEIVGDVDTPSFAEDLDSEGDTLIREQTLEERNEKRNNKIRNLEIEIISIKDEIQNEFGMRKLKIDAQNEAEKYVINKRLEKLKNCYIIEKTPNGNVLMMYENERGSFTYYSDCNIPYRYLEVVGRKYVKSFNCRPLFVDMEEELKLFEEKWEKEQEAKKLKEEEEKKKNEEAAKNQQTVQVKKNVFAKFKSYNKEAGGKISMAAPPKNSISTKGVNENKENEKVLLKERANRYTYEGKFANFNFLQKIERKVFNKKLGLSFADFKKITK